MKIMTQRDRAGSVPTPRHLAPAPGRADQSAAARHAVDVWRATELLAKQIAAGYEPATLLADLLVDAAALEVA